MKNSYILRTWGGRVVLSGEIADQLNLAPTTILYAFIASEPQVSPSLIVSPLPPSTWDSAYRIVVYVGSKPGSLANVTQELASDKVNLLSAWSATTSAEGEGCFTAVAQIPPEKLGVEYDERQLAADIEKALAPKGALSTSHLFSGPSPLQRVRIVKLRVLAKLFELCSRGDALVISLDNWVMNLQALRTTEGQEFDFLQMTNDSGAASDYVVLTPDTEERYIKIGALPRQRYEQLHVPVRLSGDPANFRGCFTEVLMALAKEDINVMSAQNHLVSKRESGPNVGEEDADFFFTIALPQNRLIGSVRSIRNRLAASIKTALDNYGHSAKIKVSASKKGIALKHLENLSPLVFLATNAKPGLESRHIRFTRSVIQLLKRKRLQPVNVDRNSRNALKAEVETLLSLCPIVIVLYLPEEGNRLFGEIDKNGKNSDAARSPKYAPSDYTMYEEAFAFASRQCFVKRLRHQDVYGARYAENIEIKFSDERHDVALDELDRWLERMLADPLYLRHCRACDQRKLKVQLSGSEHWMGRDIEAWLDRRG